MCIIISQNGTQSVSFPGRILVYYLYCSRIVWIDKVVSTVTAADKAGICSHKKVSETMLNILGDFLILRASVVSF